MPSEIVKCGPDFWLFLDPELIKTSLLTFVVTVNCKTKFDNSIMEVQVIMRKEPNLHGRDDLMALLQMSSRK